MTHDDETHETRQARHERRRVSTLPEARCYAGACSDCDCDLWEGDAAGVPYRASWGYDLICAPCAKRDGCNAVGTLTRADGGWVLT